MLVEFCKDALHRGVEERLGIDRFQIRPLDRRQHLAEVATVHATVTGGPGQNADDREQAQEEKVSLRHDAGRAGDG